MIVSSKFSAVIYNWTKFLIKVVVGVLFCLLVINYFHGAYQRVIMNEQERAKRVSNNIELHLQGRIKALELLANAPKIRNLDKTTVILRLQGAIRLLGCSNLFVFDSFGYLIGSAIESDFIEDYRDNDSFTLSLTGCSAVSNRITTSKVNDSFVSLSVPIYNANKVIGVLSAGVSLKEIGWLVLRERVSDKQYVYVMDSKGQFIYHPRLEEIYPEGGKYNSHLHDFFIRSSGDMITSSFLDGIKKLYVYVPVDGTNWRVVSAMPMRAVFEKVLKQSMTDILAVLLLIIGMVFLYHLLREAEIHQEKLETMRMERLMTVNQMAAGMAHEIRNPLTSIKGFIQLLQRRAELLPLQNYLDIVFKEIEHIEKLTNEFQMLAKPVKPLRMQKIDLIKTINSVILLVAAQAAGKKTSLEFKPIQRTDSDGSDHYYVMGDEAQLKQVWLNLLRNSIDAVDGKGKIEVYMTLQGNQVLVQIKDNGMGIPHDLLSKIGTPFFTTKETGTGLGLSICYNIIDNHKGKIEIDSKEGEGTVFSVFLPVVVE